VVFHRSSGSASVRPCSACVDLVVAFRLQAVHRRPAWVCVRRTFSWCVQSVGSDCAIAADTEDTLFNKILRCDYHIQQYYLPDRPEVFYNLKKRHHDMTLSHRTVDLNHHDFLVRNLYTTRSSAIDDGTRDAPCQLKPC